METLFYLAILLLSGYFFARILGLLKFPDVTGYLIAGIIVGPSVFHLISDEGVSSLGILSTIALSFIAFSVGSEMNLKKIKQMGSKIFIVTFSEALGAVLIVTLTMLFVFHLNLPSAIILGSIASATAPAATLMVIKQYQAKGDLVDVLIPVVALDDAVCIMAFGIASSIGSAMISGADLSINTMLFQPLLEIVLAIVVGAVGGVLYIVLSRTFRNDGENLSFTLATIFVITAIALKFNLSSLLTLMMTGLVISNFGPKNRRYLSLINTLTPPLFIIFFVLSGADLKLSDLSAVGIIGIGYVVARVIGKFGGAFISTKAVGFPQSVQNNLGLTLVPQAGVAIGLSLIASQIVPDPFGSQIRTIVLGATIIYELIGPLLAKFALTKAGCINKN
ncbi:cation:proton antiporter [Allofustis seminis]|uniref:cation:proton antiporter n=1 Tax=Allofustis seminis TaxID=166939 RepID=UPI0003736B1B|nr:cation:proton antiporter [Allofustis seminis]